MNSYCLIFIIILCTCFSSGCIESTLIPGQNIKETWVTRVAPPHHHELLSGGLLEKQIVAGKLANKARYCAFFPLRLMVIGNSLNESSIQKLQQRQHNHSVMQEEKKRQKLDKMLSSKNAQRRELGLELLSYGNFKDKDNDKILISALNNKDPYIRMVGVRTLGKQDRKIITTYLGKLFNDPNEFVRLETIRVVKALQLKAFIVDIHRSLRDPSVLVRGEGILAIESLENQESIPHLWSMLRDDEIFIRELATKALEKLTGTKIDFPYYAPLNVREDKLRKLNK